MSLEKIVLQGKKINFNNKVVAFLLPVFLFLSVFILSCKSLDKQPEKEQREVAKRVFYNARLEPEKGVLHGAGQDPEGYNDYCMALNSDVQPIIYMNYINVTKSVEQIELWGNRLKCDIQKLPSDIRVQLGLSFKGIDKSGQRLDSLTAMGHFDEQIHVVVSILKNINRPVYIRSGYEFEGRWNNYHPTYFKEVFVKLTKKLRNEDVEAAMVWCSAGGSAGFKNIENLMKFYPGDNWVDWWGIDIFSPSEITDQRLKTFYKKADEHRKPVMVGESTPRYVGVAEGEQSWNNWFKPFFDMIYNTPQIKAFCYINWEWNYWGEKLGHEDWRNWKDGRIEQNNFISSSYNNELEKGVFIHSVR